MKSFTVLKACAAPLPLVNVDTDMIIPKQFLRTIARTGLGKNLFDDMRYNADGSEKPDFVLNRPQYRQAEILVTGENFGCGSSREHAPWALLDFGIRAVIAPSFADIFANNCIKNGIVPVVLPQDQVAVLMQRAKDNQPITVNLESCVADEFSFKIQEHIRHCLLNGLDDIGLTLQNDLAITQFEQRDQQQRPWLWSA